MNTRKVVFLFNTTLLIGTTAGFIIAFILDWRTHINDLADLQFGGFIMIIITPAIWTVIAQMGFFAYLTVHRFGLGIFKSMQLWNRVQVIIIAFVLFDLMFFRHLLFAEDGESMLGYTILPILLLAYALIVAYIKTKETNISAFIPTVFFMVVVTSIEWIPALRENELTFLISSIVPLLVANTWQILVLHHLNQKDEKDKNVQTKNNRTKVKARPSK
ncbi:KinB-signaling pathway activation protein [Evansella sp. AB-P1]|uniref:KinB-signaling pathway activation protein n=1 Tax=Evansella sp. AB-P1 TaxID=3037653 RepID=UPI00241DBC3B|nr:KinB-signaling pathway activation protein [Evansella sp. AB-P1]MDG5788074.1 KinB-signaling pathway activation protein [Evansella sp. AB-P1]